MAIESLLERSVAEDEAISIRTLASASTPEWLQQSLESARQAGLDLLSTEGIDALSFGSLIAWQQKVRP